MNTAQPIRNLKDLEHLKKYYIEKEPNPRNSLLITLGLNTALRISDQLTLRWGQFYDFEARCLRTHLELLEQKTGKSSLIYINQSIKNALCSYARYLRGRHVRLRPDMFVFPSRSDETQPMSRVQAFRIIKKAAEACKIDGTISCHSLRKTFGYYAWKQGTSPVLLMNIYNHSSFRVTQRYLGIEQDDRDEVFQNIEI